jgi:hypothetical protein
MNNKYVHIFGGELEEEQNEFTYSFDTPVIEDRIIEDNLHKGAFGTIEEAAIAARMQGYIPWRYDESPYVDDNCVRYY